MASSVRGEGCRDTGSPSLMSAQGRETPLEVQCCDSGLDENLSLPKVGAVREKGSAQKDWSRWCGGGRKMQEVNVVMGLCSRASDSPPCVQSLIGQGSHLAVISQLRHKS
jgi:hypothetical protein